MGTISSAFSLISGALNADQSALNIIAGNVANANTPGYTREAPTWQENTPVTINGIPSGAAGTVRGLGSLTRRMQSGNIRSYAGWLALGAAAVVVVMIFGRSLWVHF